MDDADIVNTLRELRKEAEDFEKSDLKSHCGIPGNKSADILGKEGGRLPQVDTSMAHEEAKSVIKITFKNT